LVRNFEDEKDKKYPLTHIAPTLAKAGDFEQILKIAQKIKGANNKAITLNGIASTLASG
jgi:hypothetical protein